MQGGTVRFLLVAAVLFGSCLPVLATGCGGSAEGGETTAPAAGGSRMVAGGNHIDRTACEALRRTLTGELGRPVQAKPRLKPLRFTECQLRSALGLVVVYLDATIPVRKRYLVRIHDAKVQARDAGKQVEPVAGIGEGRGGQPGAYWLPTATSSLYAYRKDGWMTLLYGLEGESNSQRRAGAVALAKRTFELTDGT